MDGRRLRRERNVNAVRTAIIDLLADGVTPTMSAIAERSEMHSRSVYRYFGDVDAAVVDAIEHRRQQVFDECLGGPTIDPTKPFTVRLALLADRRFRLQELVHPVAAHLHDRELVERLDIEIRTTFETELRSADGVIDDELARSLCAVFRPAAVFAFRLAFDGDESAASKGLARVVTTMLAASSGD